MTGRPVPCSSRGNLHVVGRRFYYELLPCGTSKLAVRLLYCAPEKIWSVGRRFKTRPYPSAFVSACPDPFADRVSELPVLEVWACA